MRQGQMHDRSSMLVCLRVRTPESQVGQIAHDWQPVHPCLYSCVRPFKAIKAEGVQGCRQPLPVVILEVFAKMGNLTGS